MVLMTELKTVDGPTFGMTEVGFGIAIDDAVPELLSFSSPPSLDPSLGVSGPLPGPSPGVSPSPSPSPVPLEGVPVDGTPVGFASSPQSALATDPGFPPTSVKVAETVRAERATRVSVEKRILMVGNVKVLCRES